MGLYYVLKLLINDQDQYAPTITAYESLEAAQVAYHNTLAAFHNAPDVKYAIVEVLSGNGNAIMKEEVRHMPEPEPEPEPEEPEE